MRLRNTLILAVLFAALAGYLYFVEIDKAAQESKKKTLLDFKSDAVTAVTLTYPDRTIALKREDSTWRLVQPIEDLADEPTVDNLLRAIADCELKKTLDNVPTDLAPYGLDQPKVQITLTLKDGELPLIKVGKNAPVGFTAYVQRADDPKVYLTPASFSSGMDKQVKDLRDKQILTFTDDSIRRLTVDRSSGHIAMKKTDAAWLLEEPVAATADAGTIRSFISTLRSLRATDFVAEQAGDLSAYGLDHPRITITLSGDKEDDQRQLLVGNENDKKDVYVKVATRPTVYTAGSFAARDLDKSLNDFRDKTIVAFAPDAVTAIEVARKDGGSFTLTQKDKDTWALAGNDAVPEKAKVTQLLTDLKDLKGYEIAADTPTDLAPFGLTAPEVTITLRGNDAPIAAVLFSSVAGEPDKKEFTAMREGLPTVFRVRDYIYNRVNKTAKDFLPRPTPTVNTTPGAQPPAAEEPESDGDALDMGGEEE